MRQLMIPFLSACCGLAPLSAARAEVMGLLIGVGDYQYLDADLQGPGFDVALMAEVLIGRGVAPDALITLTTMPDAPGMPQGTRMGQPTRAAILAAMQDLTSRAEPGDSVLFYFSGHGSQAPDLNGDEQGGADEILLPMDASGWKGAVASVENALLDDELESWAKSLTDRGVRLIGMIDACHSGTGFRAVSGQGTARVLPPEALGIPDDLPEPVAPLATADKLPLGGEFVFLYSSQSDQRSFEFPIGEGQDQRWHGAFTLAVTQVMREAPNASWRQVLAATRDRMTQGSVRQEPDAEGTMLDTPLFGTGSATARFAVEGGVVQAGLLQGLTEGSQISLFASPSGGEALASATLAKPAPNKTEVTFAAPSPEAAVWAEVTAPAPPAPLRLANPLRRDEADYTDLLAALDAVVEDGIAVWDNSQPDLVPILTEGRLALTGPDGQLDAAGPGASPRVTLREGEDVMQATFRLLENAAHTTRIRAVLAGLGGRGFSIGGPPVTVAVERRAAAPSSDQSCKRGEGFTPHDPAKGVANCDELWLTLTNQSGRVQDITVLYQARDFTLTPIWPVRNLSNRLALGESTRIGLRVEAHDGAAFAEEEILIIALSPEVSERRADLSALATPDRLRDIGPSAGAADTTGAFFGLVSSLMEPEEQGSTRSFSPKRPALTLLRQAVRLHP